jgi:hypothetical protein
MGLSEENKNPHVQTAIDFRAQIDWRHARNLADRLVKCDHNPDPREAPNPAHGIRIRKIVPFRHFPVTDEVKEHNANVSGVGSPEQFKHTWGNFS